LKRYIKAPGVAVLPEQYMRERFLRQIILKGVGEGGQEKLFSSKVLVVGAGATGCAQAEVLARMGVGEIRIVDPDTVEESNLHRQFCYSDEDLGAFKVERALKRLEKIHPHIKVLGALGRIEEVWRDVAPGVDIILDGTDCMSAREFINEVSVHLSIPWIFTGVAGSFGQSVLLSPDGPCLRCFMEESITPLTCDTEGVYPTAAVALSMVAAHTAVKYLLGRGKEELGVMKVLDMEHWTLSRVKINPWRECSLHAKRRFRRISSFKGDDINIEGG